MDSTRGVGRTLTLAMMWLGIVLCVVLLCGWLASARWSGRLDVRSFPASGQRSVCVYAWKVVSAFVNSSIEGASRGHCCQTAGVLDGAPCLASGIGSIFAMHRSN